MSTTQIIFIDSRITDFPSFINHLPTGAEVFVLDSAQDGLTQIAAVLAGRTGIDAIHVVSHGSQGALYLGNAQIDGNSLSLYKAPLSSIGASLTPTGDILLYGCNVAQGDVGLQFISSLAQATGADVAASDDATGAAALGGDAVLEQTTGPVEAPVLNGNGQGFTTLLAAPSFAAKVDYATGNGPVGLINADVNGDGKADLILSSYGSNTVSVLKNNGDGTFAAKVDYATNGWTYQLTSADLNSDGKADLIVANFSSDTVSVLMGRGDGTFAAKVDYATGSSPHDVTSTDVNGDGKADLIVANQNSNTISVLLGNGNGTFATKVDYATGSSSYLGDITSTDVNGDGKVDLILSNINSNTVSVLTNNGDGTFAAKVDYATGDGSSETASADVNGDGKADLIVSNWRNQTVSVLMNNGNGTFAARVGYATGSSPDGVTSGDVNGDGKADLIVANSGSNTISVLTNNGDGTFAAKLDYTTGSSPGDVTSADVNGDGKADLIVTNTESGTVSVLMNTSATVAPTPTYNLTANAASYNEGSNAIFTLTTTNVAAGTVVPYTLSGTGITAADVVGGTLTGTATVGADGKAAITVGLAADATTEGAETLTVTANGSAASTTIVDTSTSASISAPSFAARVDYVTGWFPQYVISADVNGDGKADLITTNNDGVSVLTNNGDGSFAAKVDYVMDMNQHPSSVTSADVNGDGKADLIVANGYSNNTVSLLINNGDGTFAAKVDYATGSTPVSVTSADVNSDGKADLIVANTDSNTVSVLTNNGNGTFAGRLNYATGDAPFSVTSADVNSDGKADLIVANGRSNTVSVLTNNGDGTFAAKVDYATGDGSDTFGVAVTSADVNGDSKADLILTNQDSNTVSVLTNNGDGTFAAKVDYATGSSPVSVTSADVNSDGKADLILANPNSHTISVLTNNGDGSFAAKVDYAMDMNQHPYSVTSADVNGDGKADLIVANWIHHTVSVLMNTFGTVTPTYSLTANAPSYNEGSNAIFTLTTTNVAAGTVVPYTLSGTGITAADVTGGALNGSVTVSNNTATLTIPLAADLTTEGNETLTVTVAGVTVSTVVTDISTGSNPNNHAPTGNVTISGTAKQGQTLTASNTLADVDGLGTISYQWQADGVAISGATAKTINLTQAQVGKAISVTASYTDRGGTLESKTSTASSAVLNINDAPTGSVTISGTTTQGQTLTASNTLADADGLGTISYQWKANGVAISGATTSTLDLAQAQVGKLITVTASYTDGGRTVESKTSNATSAIVNINDAPTGDVTISGTVQSGKTLTANSSLADVDRLGALKYQWLADDTAISGATARTFALGESHIGKAISVAVSYTDLGGMLESKTSVATSAVENIDGVLPGSVSISSLDLITAEDGKSAVFSVQLNKAPIDPVTVQFAVSDTTEATLPTTSLTFTSTNWNTAQSLTVVGNDDDLEDGDITYQLKATVVSDDLFYKRVTIKPIELINENDRLDAPIYVYGDGDSNTLQGNRGADYLYGRGGNDNLSGDRGNDWLYGGSGDDTLDGGVGADNMDGGDGSDIYYVDDAKDVVKETNPNLAKGGVDTVISTLSSYALPANIENGAINNNNVASLSGNTLDNILYAAPGDNVLNGISGIDTVSYLYGLVSGATTGVNISLATGVAQTTGGSGKDTLLNIQNITGSSLDDRLTGNNRNNVLDGGAGNDMLVGGLGKDTLLGGVGNDVFDFNAINEMGASNTTWDVIVDFVSGQDKIDLSTLDANALTTSNDAFNGTLIAAADNFTAAGQLKLVVFNGTGVLYGNVDADSEAEFAIQLTGVTTLSATDFVL